MQRLFLSVSLLLLILPVGVLYAQCPTSGAVITFSDFDGGIIRREITKEETDRFKKVFVTADRMKKFYTGSFYPLCDETTLANNIWCGWQFDRDDLHSGFAIVFRRAEAPEESYTFTLGNIDADADYEIEIYDGEKKTLKGKDLQTLDVKLPSRPFQLMFYAKK